MQAHDAPADEEISQTSSQESADGEDETEEEDEDDADASVDHDNVSNFLVISISATYDTSHALRRQKDVCRLSFIFLMVTHSIESRSLYSKLAVWIKRVNISINKNYNKFNYWETHFF